MIAFPDVSNYQGALTIQGALALIAKHSQGSTYADPRWGGFVNQADGRGIPFSSYHWVDNSSVQGQAYNAGTATPMMWDCEDLDANLRPTLTVGGILAVHHAYTARPGTGHAWGAYLPRWYWERMGSPDLRPLAAAGLALVASDYSGIPGAGTARYGGVAPAIVQFTNAQAFNGQHVDFNRYPGTVEQLRALWTGKVNNDVSTFLIAVTDGSRRMYISDGFDLDAVRDDAVVRTALGNVMPTVTAATDDQAHFIGSHQRSPRNAGQVTIPPLAGMVTLSGPVTLAATETEGRL